jgi:hypothetical protein
MMKTNALYMDKVLISKREPIVFQLLNLMWHLTPYCIEGVSGHIKNSDAVTQKTLCLLLPGSKY